MDEKFNARYVGVPRIGEPHDCKQTISDVKHSGQSMPDSELMELYRTKVKQLQDMGFEKTEKELAQLLHRCRGDTQTACLSLMGCT